MERRIKYLELSTKDFGGAGHYELLTVERLRERGIDAKLIVWNKKSDKDFVIGVHNSNKWTGRLAVCLYHVISYVHKRIVHGKPKDRRYIFYDIQINRISAKKILQLYGEIPDVIAIGWVSDFISTKTIYELKQMTNAKIVYFMIDNAPIGGGCHYPWDCQGYTKDCYPCPALKSGCRRAQKTLEYKHRYITPDMMISGTTNDINRAEKSLLFKHSPSIKNVVLTANPYSFDRLSARKHWGIDESKYVIFCGAASVNDKRKGFSQLINALESIKERESDVSRFLILVAGGGSINFPDGFEVMNVGVLPFKELFMAYGCSDLFVCPSLEDSGPMMINYGVMAFVPVVAFEMGVALDVILHKKNGYIAKWKDANDFAEGILYWYHHGFDRSELKQMNRELADKLKETRSFWTYFDNVIVPGILNKTNF